MLQADYPYMSWREIHKMAGMPVAKPSRITGEGRFHRRGMDKAAKYGVKKKRAATRRKKASRRRNRGK